MKDPRALAEEFVQDVQRTLGTRLRGAALFGSAARGEWVPSLSDVNVLVLVEQVDAPTLAEVAPAARRAIDRGVRPLLMEQEEWRRAHDVFAIEVADMRDAHVSLVGDDPAASAVVDATSLRLQAEREIRAKLVHLHAGMMALSDSPELLGELFLRALPSFTAYLRAALRLAGQPVPGTSAEVIPAACRLIGADPAPFEEVREARAAGRLAKLTLRDPLPDRFNTAAERLAAYIDDLGGNTP